MNAYIDLGAFNGAFISRFQKSQMYVPGCSIHAFECNPYLAGTYYGDGVVTHNVAAWVFDGETDFFVSQNKPALIQGSSVFREKITGNLDVGHPRRVKCIDFSKWIADNFRPDDNIVIKSNIEGAEYEVFRKCISDGTITYFKKMWMRWHYHKCGIDKAIHDQLKADIVASGVELHESYEDFL